MINRVWALVRQQELSMLLTMFLLAGIAWTFIWITGEAIGGDSHAFDERLLMSMRVTDDPSNPIGPHWLEELMRDITGLGGVGVLTFITLVVAGFLVLENKWRVALVVLVTIGSGIALSLLMKMGFDRPRPALVPHESYVYTTSFPSGHSMMSAVVYLSLASLMARVQRNRRIKVYLISVAMLLTVLIGVSRVYMGVHWPTDVLAGWMAGVFWALLCYLITRHLQRSGSVEQAGLQDDPEQVESALTAR